MDAGRRALCAARRGERADMRRDEASTLADRHRARERARGDEMAALDARWRSADAQDAEAMGDLDRRAEEETRRHEQVLRLLAEERRVEEATRFSAQADRRAARERIEKRHAGERAAEQREWAKHQREHARQQEMDDEEAEMLAQVESEHAFYLQKAAAIAGELAGENQRQHDARKKAEKMADFERRSDDLLAQRKASQERRQQRPAAAAPEAIAAPRGASPKLSSPYSNTYAARGTAGAYLPRGQGAKRTTDRLSELGLLDRIERQVTRNQQGGEGVSDSFGRDIEDPTYTDQLRADETTVWSEAALRREFERFDADRSGCLDKKEALHFFATKCAERGISKQDIPSWERLKVILGRADPMQIASSDAADDKIDFNEFCLLMLWLAKR